MNHKVETMGNALHVKCTDAHWFLVGDVETTDKHGVSLWPRDKAVDYSGICILNKNQLLVNTSSY